MYKNQACWGSLRITTNLGNGQENAGKKSAFVFFVWYFPRITLYNLFQNTHSGRHIFGDKTREECDPSVSIFSSSKFNSTLKVWSIKINPKIVACEISPLYHFDISSFKITQTRILIANKRSCQHTPILLRFTTNHLFRSHWPSSRL